MSQICADYGLDVWIWYPGDGRGLRRPEDGRARARRSGARCSSKLPRIDAVFVPGGDPGHTQPEVPHGPAGEAGRQPPPLPPRRPDVGLAAGLLGRSGSTSSSRSCKPSPPWLGGVVYGPQVRVSLPELRKAVPAQVPDPRLPRHHPQPALPVPGPRLGRRLLADRRPRGDQPPPARRVGDLPRVRRPDDRLHHLFGRAATTT